MKNYNYCIKSTEKIIRNIQKQISNHHKQKIIIVKEKIDNENKLKEVTDELIFLSDKLKEFEKLRNDFINRKNEVKG